MIRDLRLTNSFINELPKKKNEICIHDRTVVYLRMVLLFCVFVTDMFCIQRRDCVNTMDECHVIKIFGFHDWFISQLVI
jgi:hypothetical protein